MSKKVVDYSIANVKMLLREVIYYRAICPHSQDH